MQTGMKTKIKSTSGATLMVALLIFLLLAVYGAVVLHGSMAGAERIRRLDGTYRENALLLGSCETLRDAVLDAEPSVLYETQGEKVIYEDKEASPIEKMLQKAVANAPETQTGTIKIRIPEDGKKTTLKDYKTLTLRMCLLKEENLFRMEILEPGGHVTGVLAWHVSHETWTNVQEKTVDGDVVFENHEMTQVTLHDPVIRLEVPGEK